VEVEVEVEVREREVGCVGFIGRWIEEGGVRKRIRREKHAGEATKNHDCRHYEEVRIWMMILICMLCE
jgi:hypothetical protein